VVAIIATSRTIPKHFIFFTLQALYNEFFFNVFNITDIENNVNDKYSTKNNITEGIDVFLPIKNHIRAMISSIRNLAVMLTSV